MNKIKTLANLQEIILKLKNQGKQIVFTNGCFDILHLGHLKILKEAKKKGDILIVGVNSDFSIKKIKGKKRPILNEKTRTHILESIVPCKFRGSITANYYSHSFALSIVCTIVSLSLYWFLPPVLTSSPSR